MIDGQARGFWRQDEIEGIAPQGFDLHGHVDIEVVCFLREPDLDDPVALQIEMFIAPLRRRRDGELMVDDALRPVDARVETQPLRAEPHRTRILIVGAMLDVEEHR
jgi:hypothetical protein